MKKLYSICTILCCLGCGFSQTVVLPDTNFASYLSTAVPDCMNGNELNIPCANNSSITQMILGNMGLTNLSGVEHFTNLTHLLCGMNEITSIPVLPPNLQYFMAGFNQLTQIPDLPNSLLLLDCSHNQVSELPTLPQGLIELMCFNNQLTALNNLPNSLTYIVASNNQITEINALPTALNYLDLSYNTLTQLPELPSAMTLLSCRNNALTELPDLPNLLTLHADSNQIQCFPIFPLSINAPVLDFVFLTLQGNFFTCLPNHIPAMTPDLLAYPVCIESPQDDVHNCSKSSVGLNENSFSVSVFPNPSLGSFYIDGAKPFGLKVLNPMGQLVAFDMTHESETRTKLDLQAIVPGVYYVHLDFDKTHVVKRLLVLEN